MLLGTKVAYPATLLQRATCCYASTTQKITTGVGYEKGKRAGTKRGVPLLGGALCVAQRADRLYSSEKRCVLVGKGAGGAVVKV